MNSGKRRDITPDIPFVHLESLTPDKITVEIASDALRYLEVIEKILCRIFK
jgi:hypothetical protein